jgi:hypothetical protein
MNVTPDNRAPPTIEELADALEATAMALDHCIECHGKVMPQPDRINRLVLVANGLVLVHRHRNRAPTP